MTRPLHITTPLVRSVPMSKASGAEIWLKLESAQPVGSFKIRGIGRACQEYVAAGARRLVASSGGNAGYAVAYAGRRLGVPVEVFVPETTPDWMRQVIRGEAATVTEHGASWDDAHTHAVALANAADTAYLHPFDDPRIWQGHATMVEEIAAQLRTRPDAVVVAVGGGGLLLGVLEGLHGVGWSAVPVVAVETAGADSFAQSVECGELVTLASIDSIASSLGARTVAQTALEWTARHEVRPHVVTDREAVAACIHFANEHRVLVEPACGAALAAARDGVASGRVLVICCGGAAASLDQLAVWRRRVGL